MCDPSIAQSANIGPGQIRVPKYLFKLVYDQDKYRVWAHWVEHIKRNRRNAGILGQADDLEDFLFCASRQSLLAMGQGLRKIDGPKYFYCAQALTEASWMLCLITLLDSIWIYRAHTTLPTYHGTIGARLCSTA